MGSEELLLMDLPQLMQIGCDECEGKRPRKYIQTVLVTRENLDTVAEITGRNRDDLYRVWSKAKAMNRDLRIMVTHWQDISSKE